MHDVIMISDCFEITIVYCYHTHFATQNGRTVLFEASLEGHVAIVRLLLEKRADVNICANVRNTDTMPLELSAHIHSEGHGTLMQ